MAATVIFRFAGHWFLALGDTSRLAFAYLGAVPLIAAVTLPIYRLCRLDPATRLRAAVLTALPGMMLDMVSILVFDRIFPNLSPEAVAPFGSWLFWAYTLILLSGLISFGRQPS